MGKFKHGAWRLFVTASMITNTTEFSTRHLGAKVFLPELFKLRYANLGGLDVDLFGIQLSGARSFTDKKWCAYWDPIAEKHLADAKLALQMLVGSESVAESLLAANNHKPTRILVDMLGQLPQSIIDLLARAPQTTMHQLMALAQIEVSPSSCEQLKHVMCCMKSLLKAITYYQVSAFPGGSPSRMLAYAESRRLFERLYALCGPLLEIKLDKVRIPVDGDVVEGYAIFPASTTKLPLVIITNGLEGTAQELVIPLLPHQKTGLATFFMEMPGTYVYQQPMSDASEQIYHQVFDYFAADSRVDAKRMAFVGLSFGGYWAARMAAKRPDLKCVVANGAPTHRSFTPSGAIGIPEIIIKAMKDVTGASTQPELGEKLHALSLADVYGQIKMPLLVINGDNDTLLSTRDSIELAEGAQQGTLKLYPDDDHTAMKHYHEWIEFSQEWILEHI